MDDPAVGSQHEQIVRYYDQKTGMRAMIALHNTKLGPGLGGTRLWPYPSEEAALIDVLRLSEGMTNKAAVADLPLGGGKAVIIADGREQDPVLRAERFRTFGRYVEELSGRYITTEDVGTTPQDMAEIRHSTRFVMGTPVEEGGSGDPSPMTAFGVLCGIKALAEEVLEVESLAGVRIAVQGLGKVGMSLAQHLVEEGAVIIGADIRPDLVEATKNKLKIEVVDADTIYDVPCAIFAPCAMGAILNDHTIPRLSCRIVAGCANNQLAEERHGQMLHERQILYAVDYVINAGGLINVATEWTGYDEQKARAKTAQIYHTIKRMLTIAREERISMQQAAQQMVRQALGESCN